MNESILIRRGRRIARIPRDQWDMDLTQVPAAIRGELAFMTEEHHRVRNLVVRELPVLGAPMTAAQIANELKFSEESVTRLLDDLEEHLTFLYRNPEGAVVWAYPVTVENTSHRISFSSGEQIYAA